MSYDWHNEIGAPRFSAPWFDAIDQRFIDSARLYGTDQQPFDRIIPFGRLAGADVLEIGCGMGLHTQLMASAGARVTAVDLSPTSVEATTHRLALKGLPGRILEGDAERLPFPDKSFDFVWSWGVIHHSSRTGRVVREIARVCRPNAEVRVMVYNRNGAWAYSILITGSPARPAIPQALVRGDALPLVGRLHRALLRAGAVRRPLSDVFRERVLGVDGPGERRRPAATSGPQVRDEASSGGVSTESASAPPRQLHIPDRPAPHCLRIGRWRPRPSAPGPRRTERRTAARNINQGEDVC